MNKCTITIGKKKINFHFGMYFLGEVVDELKIGIEDFFEKLQSNPYKIIPLTMYKSAKYAAERKGLELDLTLYDIVDLIESEPDGGIEVITKFTESLTNSMTKNVPKQTVNPSTRKKK